MADPQSTQETVKDGNKLVQPQPLAQPDDSDDFPLGKACDLSGEGNCEACQ